jgi:hypothetical protein
MTPNYTQQRGNDTRSQRRCRLWTVVFFSPRYPRDPTDSIYSALATMRLAACCCRIASGLGWQTCYFPGYPLATRSFADFLAAVNRHFVIPGAVISALSCRGASFIIFCGRAVANEPLGAEARQEHKERPVLHQRPAQTRALWTPEPL